MASMATHVGSTEATPLLADNNPSQPASASRNDPDATHAGSAALSNPNATHLTSSTQEVDFPMTSKLSAFCDRLDIGGQITRMISVTLSRSAMQELGADKFS